MLVVVRCFACVAMSAGMLISLYLSGDTPTATVSPTTGLNTTEAGGIAVFTVVLDAQPLADVTLGLSSTDVGEGILSSSSLTFAVGQWNISQTMTVTGVDDVWVDGDISYNVSTGAMSSSDTNFNGESVADVWGVVNMDGTAQIDTVLSVLVKFVVDFPSVRPSCNLLCCGIRSQVTWLRRL